MKNKDYEKIKLSHGAIKELNIFYLTDNKQIAKANYIFQIYDCFPLLNNDYYSCTLFDDEKILNTFFLKYDKNEGKPFKGDIILVDKIYITNFDDKEDIIFICKGVKIIKKSADFLVDPHLLDKISIKKAKENSSIDSNNIENNTFIFNNFDNKEKEKEKEISKTIKVLILLFINEQNFDIINNNKNYQKFSLINKNFLDEYTEEYEMIKNILNNNIEVIIGDIQKISDNNLACNLKYLDNIISKLDKKLLIKVDDEIEEKNLENSQNSLNPKSKLITLIDKQITIFKEFIFVNEHIFNYINSIFDNMIKQEKIDYLSHKYNDIITVENKPQNTIFILNKNNKNNLDEIEYILDYNTYTIYTKEKKYIINCKINNYINNKTVFTNNKTDLISPLFSKNEVIGYCYKYTSSLNYKSYKNYYDYFSNESLNISTNLYFNYQKIKEQLNSKRRSLLREKIYLINKDYINDLKDECSFNIINELLEKNNIEEYDDNCNKILLSIIKSLTNTKLKKITKKININNLRNIDPDIKPFNYFDKSEKTILIYDNFQIIHEYLIKKMKTINNINNYHYIAECIITEGKIIINYKDNLNDKKSISAIGILNNQNIFMIEYVLIFNSEKERKENINYIINNITNFLNGLKLYNDSQPIVDNNYKEIGIIAKNDISYIKNNFNFSPKIGLENIGATCYMNATLQCFCHIEKFVNFFKNNKQAIDIYNNDKKSLTFSFKLLIDNLWPNDYNNQENKYYAPKEFKNKISDMNPLFKGIAANDAKDLVNFIIMTLHQELNKVKKTFNVNNNIIFDQKNKDLMFQHFANNFMSINQSIISDLFYAINCTITECGLCHTKLYNYQTYFFIIFPLEEVRKFKYNNQFNFININNFFNFNNINNNQNNIVDIYDCFNYDKKINIMSGSNSIYCNFCKINCNGSMVTYLTTGPEILILLLNRGKGIEFDVKINFYENLDLKNYIGLKQTGYNYKLIGVITHIGESSMSGHFIAYCKDPITNKWYKYNDAIVSDVNDFNKEVINFANPYLLFYQKTKYLSLNFK